MSKYSKRRIGEPAGQIADEIAEIAEGSPGQKERLESVEQRIRDLEKELSRSASPLHNLLALQPSERHLVLNKQTLDLSPDPNLTAEVLADYKARLKLDD